MACSVTLAGITYDCTDLSVGGIKRVLVGNKSTVLGHISVTNGVVTVSTSGLKTAGHVKELEFNTKDAFSNFTDVKTVNADGTFSVVPTVQIEFPKMTPEKRAALETLSTPGAEYIVFVETAAGTYHMLGYNYGVYAGTIDGASGAARGDKNRYQVTLTGEENELAATLTSTEWGDVVA